MIKSTYAPLGENFDNDKITPLVGDNVLFNEKTLQIEKILERKNFLFKWPMIANVDIAVVITSTKNMI